MVGKRMSAEVLSLAEAVEYLRLNQPGIDGERRLRGLVNQHKIGAIKTGRLLTFPVAALEQYVANNTTAVVAPNPFGLSDRSAARLAKGRASQTTGSP